MSWREAAAIGVVVAMLATSRAEAQAPLPAKAGADWLGKRVVQKARAFSLRDDRKDKSGVEGASMSTAWKGSMARG